MPLSNPSSVFDATKHIRLVPQFHEDDADKYFVMFEKVAHSLNWPKDKWVLLLQSVLKGKAQQTYPALSITACESYDTVKEAIKKAYELVPEAYHQQFHELKRKEGLTYVEYARDKETLFDRWCVSREVGANFENLKQLVLVEEFKRSIPSDIRTYLNEKEVTTLHDAAVVADDYALTHKSNQFKSGLFSQKEPSHVWVSNPTNNTEHKMGQPQGKQSENKTDSEPKNNPSLSAGCWYCKDPRHSRARCLAWITAGRPSTKPAGHIMIGDACNMSTNFDKLNEPPSTSPQILN